jgi:hypothetical protein
MWLLVYDSALEISAILTKVKKIRLAFLLLSLIDLLFYHYIFRLNIIIIRLTTILILIFLSQILAIKMHIYFTQDKKVLRPNILHLGGDLNPRFSLLEAISMTNMLRCQVCYKLLKDWHLF